MKLVLQIALGVFLGSFASLAAVEYWRDQKASAVAQQARNEAEQQKQAVLAARRLIAQQFQRKQAEDAERAQSQQPQVDPAAVGLPPGMPVPAATGKP